jgi:hypothetical protein
MEMLAPDFSARRTEDREWVIGDRVMAFSFLELRILGNRP